MKEIVKIAKDQGWNTLLKDSPEYRVYILALEALRVEEEKAAKEVLKVKEEAPKPKTTKRKTTKKGKK